MIVTEATRARFTPDRVPGGPASIPISVSEQSQVGDVRRRADALGAHAGLSEAERGTLAVITTEAATNLARHASNGMIVLRALGAPPSGVELLALDTSPGIHDVFRAMADGYSTMGTAGHGLGAMRRMASEFDLFSKATTGTALLARIWSEHAIPSHVARLHCEGAVCVPIATESACGDGWMFLHLPDRTLVVLADGLGHGPEAAAAADAALRIVRESAALSLTQIIETVHRAIVATRGAALAIAEIGVAEGVVRFAGVGNISGVIASPDGCRNMASHHGTVGHSLHRVQEFTYPWGDDALLIMHSDGIMSRWRLDAYPGLAMHHPALVAGTLFRDFTRARDDATVLVLRRPHD